MAGARPQALTLRAHPRGGPAGRRAARRGRGDRGGGAGGGRERSSPATPRSSAAARPTACTSARPASAASTRARALSPGRAAARRPRSSSAARSALHGTAIMLARGEFELGAEVESDTRPLWPAVDAMLERRRPRPALPARRDARRRRVRPERARARLRRGDARPRGGRAGAARSSPERRSCSASTPCTSRTRACSWRSWTPSTPTRRSPRCARSTGSASAGGDRRGADRATRHGARGDGLRRQAGHGPARGRPAAADLLREERRDGDGRVRTQPGRRRRRWRPTSCGSPSACPARATRWP